MKRVISMVLTLCMVIAMLPSTLLPLASAEEEAAKYVYSFNVQSETKYNTGFEENPRFNSVRLYGDYLAAEGLTEADVDDALVESYRSQGIYPVLSSKDKMYVDTLSDWRYTNYNKIKFNSASSPEIGSKSYFGYNKIEVQSKAVGDWIAMDIDVDIEEAASYIAEFYTYNYAYGEISLGGYYSAYLLPGDTDLSGDIDEILESNNVVVLAEEIVPWHSSKKATLGKVDQLRAGGGKVKIDKLTPGKHILLLRVDAPSPDEEGYNTSGKYNMYPGKLELTYHGPAPLEYPGMDPIHFDFSENLTAEDGETQGIPEGFTAEEAFPAENNSTGWSAYAYSENAEYIRSDTGENHTFEQVVGDHMKIATMTKGGWAAIKFPVTQKGKYTAFLKYKTVSGFANGSLYLLPAPEVPLDTEEERRDYINGLLPKAAKVDTINCNEIESMELRDYKGAAEFSFSTYTPKEYILVFQTDTKSYGKRFAITELILDGKGTMESNKLSYYYGFSYESTGALGDVNAVGYSDTGDLWRGFAASESSTAQMNSYALRVVLSKTVENPYYALKINMPSADTYYAKYHYRQENADSSNVYILPGNTKKEDIPSLLTEENLYFEGCSHNRGTGKITNKETELSEEIYLEKGEHIIVFTGIQDYNIGSRAIVIYPRGIEFIRKTTELTYGIAPAKAKLTEGEQTTVSFTDDSGNPVSDYEIKDDLIVSDNEAVATVSGTTITGGSAIGYANLSATLVFEDGTEIPAKGIVRTVIDENSGARLIANLSSTVSSYVSKTYLRDPSLYDEAITAAYDVAGFEGPDGISEEYTGGIWSWYGDNKNNGRWEFVVKPLQKMEIHLPKNMWIAIKIHFDAPGKYRLSVDHHVTNTGPHAEVYFTPVPKGDERIPDFFNDSYYVGMIDANDPDVKHYLEAPIKDSYIGDAYVDEPGDYLVVLRGNEDIANASYLVLQRFIFSGTDTPILQEEDNTIDFSRKDETIYALGVGKTRQLDKSIIAWESYAPEIMENTTLTFESLDTSVATVTPNGLVTGVANGMARIKVTANTGGDILTGVYEFTIGTQKTRRSFYTDDEVKNALRNIRNYDWAKSEAQGYITKADKFLEYDIDHLYNLITTNELPRADRMCGKYEADVAMYTCVYCGTYLYTRYGIYPWKFDAAKNPWKISCPACLRSFPSNDFESFYKLGLDEHGNWSYEKSKAENQRLINEGFFAGQSEWRQKSGYLANDLYPEKGEGFAVDDGWGYKYQYYKGDVLVYGCKPFIAVYNGQAIWEAGDVKGLIENALVNLSMAYMLTEENHPNHDKYGRYAAILMDRYADAYPDMDIYESNRSFKTQDTTAHGRENPNNPYVSDDVGRGKSLGRFHECYYGYYIIPTYDAIWPAFEDEEVISFLSEKAKKWNLENKKTSADEIRMNIENGLLRQYANAIYRGQVHANFGSHQRSMINTAVVLDTFPETGQMIEWLMRPGYRISSFQISGGELYSKLMNEIHRDGHQLEGATSYNQAWVNNFALIVKELAEYDRAGEHDIGNNPKYQRMLMSITDLVLVSEMSPNLGDNGAMGRENLSFGDYNVTVAYNLFKNDKEKRDLILRTKYNSGGQNVDKVHGSIFDEDPDEIRKVTEELVRTEGAQIDQGSRNIVGLGLAILSDGKWYNSADKVNNINTQRDFFMWYGPSTQHNNADRLALNFHAFGLEVGGDVGEPETRANAQAHRAELSSSTYVANVVIVDDHNQNESVGKPEHFDATDKVKVMEASNEVYGDLGVEDYRRTVVMVDANDDVSYGVDFFNVVGGKNHNYSFHTLARNGELSDNVVTRKLYEDENGNYKGSYQGPDAEWGASTILSSFNPDELKKKNYMPTFTYPALFDVDIHLTDAEKAQYGFVTDGLSSYSWFGEVDTAVDPANVGVFSMDWEIEDLRGALKPANPDLGVRLTMVNSFKLDEISATSFIPPRTKGSFEKVRNLFARHTGEADGLAKGEKLESLFTAVIEPYDGETYIKEVTPVTVTRDDGKPFTMDEAKAVRVLLNIATDGSERLREDYIVYAKDNTVKYNVEFESPVAGETSFAFEGFVGVISVRNDEIIYKYLNDGTTIADKTDAVAQYTGRVSGFQNELTSENYIDVAINEPVEDLSAFEDKYIYINNLRSTNGVYRILGAKEVGENIRLDIGEVTTIAGYSDVNDINRGYVYDMDVGNTFRIPMNYVDSTVPVFDELSGSLSATVDSTFTYTVHATSELGDVKYYATRLPRGASFDEKTATVTWRPTKTQTGDHVIIIEAESEGRTATQSFTVTVYGSTSGDSGSSGDDGSGGGGGGGAGPIDPIEPDEPIDPDEPTEPIEPDEPTEPTEKGFTDLGGHAWAADSINYLAEQGIVKGTSATTYSPAANITRADFAILLVRAFKLESENTENFADVEESDYFAKELAVARNTGIVGGIGDNKYAPRATITRQDMMVIVYRLLKMLEIELTSEDVSYSDFETLPEYTKEAVKALISSGLVNGKNGLIDGSANTTRAEVAVLLKRILDYVAK